MNISGSEELNYTLEDGRWKDSFDKLLEQKAILREKNILRKNVRASFNNDSSIENSKDATVFFKEPKRLKKVTKTISTPHGKFPKQPFRCKISPIAAKSSKTLFKLIKPKEKRQQKPRTTLQSTILHPTPVDIEYNSFKQQSLAGNSKEDSLEFLLTNPKKAGKLTRMRTNNGTGKASVTKSNAKIKSRGREKEKQNTGDKAIDTSSNAQLKPVAPVEKAKKPTIGKRRDVSKRSKNERQTDKSRVSVLGGVGNCILSQDALVSTNEKSIRTQPENTLNAEESEKPKQSAQNADTVTKTQNLTKEGILEISDSIVNLDNRILLDSTPIDIAMILTPVKLTEIPSANCLVNSVTNDSHLTPSACEINADTARNSLTTDKSINNSNNSQIICVQNSEAASSCSSDNLKTIEKDAMITVRKSRNTLKNLLSENYEGGNENDFALTTPAKDPLTAPESFENRQNQGILNFVEAAQADQANEQSLQTSPQKRHQRQTQEDENQISQNLEESLTVCNLEQQVSAATSNFSSTQKSDAMAINRKSQNSDCPSSRIDQPTLQNNRISKTNSIRENVQNGNDEVCKSENSSFAGLSVPIEAFPERILSRVADAMITVRKSNNNTKCLPNRVNAKEKIRRTSRLKRTASLICQNVDQNKKNCNFRRTRSQIDASKSDAASNLVEIPTEKGSQEITSTVSNKLNKAPDALVTFRKSKNHAKNLSSIRNEQNNKCFGNLAHKASNAELVGGRSNRRVSRLKRTVSLINPNAEQNKENRNFRRIRSQIDASAVNATPNVVEILTDNIPASTNLISGGSLDQLRDAMVTVRKNRNPSKNAGTLENGCNLSRSIVERIPNAASLKTGGDILSKYNIKKCTVRLNRFFESSDNARNLSSAVDAQSMENHVQLTNERDDAETNDKLVSKPTSSSNTQAVQSKSDCSTYNANLVTERRTSILKRTASLINQNLGINKHTGNSRRTRSQIDTSAVNAPPDFVEILTDNSLEEIALIKPINGGNQLSDAMVTVRKSSNNAKILTSVRDAEGNRIDHGIEDAVFNSNIVDSVSSRRAPKLKRKAYSVEQSVNHHNDNCTVRKTRSQIGALDSATNSVERLPDDSHKETTATASFGVGGDLNQLLYAMVSVRKTRTQPKIAETVKKGKSSGTKSIAKAASTECEKVLSESESSSQRAARSFDQRETERPTNNDHSCSDQVSNSKILEHNNGEAAPNSQAKSTSELANVDIVVKESTLIPKDYTNSTKHPSKINATEKNVYDLSADEIDCSLDIVEVQETSTKSPERRISNLTIERRRKRNQSSSISTTRTFTLGSIAEDVIENNGAQSNNVRTSNILKFVEPQVQRPTQRTVKFLDAPCEGKKSIENAQNNESDVMLIEENKQTERSQNSLEFVNRRILRPLSMRADRSVEVSSMSHRSVNHSRSTFECIAEESSRNLTVNLSLQPGKWRKSLSLIRRSHFSQAQIRQSFRQVSHLESIVDNENEESVEFIGCTTLIENRKTLSLKPTVDAKELQDCISIRANFNERVLRYCNQNSPLPFDKLYTEVVMQNCSKIGEGVYSEVFMRKVESDFVVCKIIPIEGSILVNGEVQKTFEQILQEIVISKELSRLRDSMANENNTTAGFVEIKKVACVQGKYPQHLIKCWETYDSDKVSENDHPSEFLDKQLYIVLESEFAGEDLESFTFNNAEQAFAAFQQIVLTLAVAEEAYEFEHRDLHWGNVLISQTNDTEVQCKLSGRVSTIPTKGIKATIIDYTLSRMKYGNDYFYYDLENEEELFTGTGDYQFDIYRMMRDILGSNWKRFEPKTNVFWLSYIVSKMENGVKYKNSRSKTHANYLRKISAFKNKILEFESACSFAKHMLDIS